MTVIDAHCHIGLGIRKRMAPDDLLRRMDQCGVSRAVLCTVDQFVAVRNREGNDQVIAAVHQWPDRFWGMAAVNPWFQQDGVDELKRCLDAGLSGLKLNSHLQGFVLSDPLVHPLVEVCRSFGGIVYAHTGTFITAEPFQLAELARTFPEVPMIMGHAGFADLWLDGVPAALQSPNIYYETSLIDLMNIGNAVAKLGPERVLFGSDAPESDLALELQKMDMVEMSPAARRLVMHDNAMALFGRHP
jgi:predicted TIM-barrel fold metal-dependent hydrolase